ncbi:MAG: hypothetical protein RI885_598 [Actinomycetota bacterium]
MEIAVALPLELEDRMLREAERHGHRVVLRETGADALASALSTGSCRTALVAASPRYLSSALLAVCDGVGVRMIGLVQSDADRRHAASVGLLETAPADAPWPEIERMLSGPAAPADAAPRRRGTVVAVWGPAGAPGRTSIAVGIASELAAAGHSVVLGDVDTHSGSVAPVLGLLDESPGFAAACRLAGGKNLTATELERIGQRYLSGHGSFWVLTGIGRPSRWPELSDERVTATIRQCRDWVDYTVLDTGSSLENDEEISSDLFAPRRNAATISALREADQVIAVGSADPVGLARFLRAHVDLVETVEPERISVVMNRVRSSAIGLNPGAQITQTLQRFGGVDEPVLVPHDQAGFDAAVLSGRALRDTAVRSAARAAIGDLVRTRILPPEPVVASRRLLRGRRMAGGGARGILRRSRLHDDPVAGPTG